MKALSACQFLAYNSQKRKVNTLSQIVRTSNTNSTTTQPIHKRIAHFFCIFLISEIICFLDCSARIIFVHLTATNTSVIIEKTNGLFVWNFTKTIKHSFSYKIKKLLPQLVKEFDTIIRVVRDRKFFSQEKERKKQPILN